MQSHVLPMPPCTWIAVSQTVRAARAQYALATRPAARAPRGRELVDGPRGVLRDADRALEQAVRLGEHVLHRLEGADRHTELPPLRRVRDADLESTAHDTHEVCARQRESERLPPGDVVAREETFVIDGAHLGVRRYGAHRTSEVGTARFARERHSREPVPVSVGDEHVRGVAPGRVDRVGRRSRVATGDGRGRECGRERDHRAVVGACARPPREVAREQRARERDIGDRGTERAGDDRGLDAARERCAVAGVVAQLEPAGVAHGRREPAGARLVVEARDGCGCVCASESVRRSAELGLLGGVAGVHVSARGSRRRPCRARRRGACSRPSGCREPAARRPAHAAAARSRAPAEGPTHRSAHHSR